MHFTPGYPSRLFVVATLCAIGMTAAFGCRSSPDGPENELSDEVGSRTTSDEEDEDGYIVEELDTQADGQPDIIRYFEEYQDPRQEDRTRRRIRKMEIDANGDAVINVRREYDEFGNVTLEENDQDLDGTMDTVLYFVGGELTRKEYLDESGEYVAERRIYYDGELVRVERDQTGNGDTNRWEYYEDGVLMRIGRDTTGDGSADTWQLR